MHNTRWLNVAIQHAKMAEAHRYDDMTLSPDYFMCKTNTLKRLWWCCVIRDRILSLCCRRSLQIPRSDFNLEAHQPLLYQDLEQEVKTSLVYDEDTKKRLLLIFCLYQELCSLLTDVLALAYPPDDSPCLGRLVPSEEIKRIQHCRFVLRNWYKTATLQARVFINMAIPVDDQNSVILYWDLTFIYYQ